jgi:hypothetical protein
VTHDRKAGADDWMTRITGTRGVSGVADFDIYIGRQRTDMAGTIYVTGRDIEDTSIQVAFIGTGWQLATPAIQVWPATGTSSGPRPVSTPCRTLTRTDP